MNFRRAFGAGASEWKHKTEEDIQKEEKERESVEHHWDAGEAGVKHSYKWALVVMAVVTLGVLGSLSYFVLAPSESAEVEIKSTQRKVASPDVSELEEGGLIIGTVEESGNNPVSAYAHRGKSLVDLVEGFLMSKTHEERLSYIVRPSEYGDRMKEFFEDKGRDTEILDVIVPASMVKSNGVQFNQVFIYFKDGSHRLAAVVETERGRLIDFEAYM